MGSEETAESRADEAQEDDPLADVDEDEPLPVEDARVLIARNEADVIDIRDDEEAFADEHIAGANHIAGADAEMLKDELPEDRRVVLVCESGEQSSEVAAKLRDEGASVFSIEGGMDSWKGAGVPVQPAPGKEFPGPKFKPPGT